MSDQKEPHENSSNSFLAFVVGGLVVAVGIIAWIMYGSDESGDVDINVDGGGDAADAVENAAESVGDAADDVTDGDSTQ